MTRRRVGIGVVGFGWMGHAHSRSCLRIPTLFPERTADADLVVVADTDSGRRAEAVEAFGFRQACQDWEGVVSHPEVDVVYVTAPNMLHVTVVEAAAGAGKHVFCEKPVGGTPAQTARAARVTREAGVLTGVGYNYRFAPLVRHLQHLVREGALGDVTTYRGRFFSMYGSDPLGTLSWRYLLDEGGYGVSSDLLSHSVDLAHALVGPIVRVVGSRATTIPERPLPLEAGTHYGRGTATDPRGAVTNEDSVSMLAEFASGAQGTFESSRTLVGPESQMAFDVHGTRGAAAWNLERLNELRLYRADEPIHHGYTTVFGGDRFPYHGAFVPGSANTIGYEDMIAIEDHLFLEAVAAGRPHEASFEEALRFVEVQDALIRSWSSGHWEDVRPVDEAGSDAVAVGAGDASPDELADITARGYR